MPRGLPSASLLFVGAFVLACGGGDDAPPPIAGEAPVGTGGDPDGGRSEPALDGGGSRRPDGDEDGSAVVTSGEECIPASPDLVAFWTADGTPADERSAYPGKLVGKISYDTGRIGKAFVISESSWVEVPDAPGGGSTSPRRSRSTRG